MITEDRLSDVLSEFARTLVTDFPIQGILDHLVQRIVDILPIGAAGVSLISPTTHPRIVAGSDETATRYEYLQTTLGEGPCVAAYETEGPISIPDLALDDRFPRFAESALSEGGSGDEPVQRVAQVQQAFVPQPQDRHGGHGFGDGSDPVLDVVIRLGAVHLAASGGPGQRTVADDAGDQARHPAGVLGPGHVGQQEPGGAGGQGGEVRIRHAL